LHAADEWFGDSIRLLIQHMQLHSLEGQPRISDVHSLPLGVHMSG